MSTVRQPPNWCDVSRLADDIADLRARIEKLETAGTGTSPAELERENAELRAQLTETHHILPLLASLVGGVDLLPPGDWTDGGKYRAPTSDELNCLPDCAECWGRRKSGYGWARTANAGRPAFANILYRVPVNHVSTTP